jgi:hypothetical protein
MQKTWTINEIRDGEPVEMVTNATEDEALRAIHAAMYGKATGLATVAPAELHELPLAA